jgi:nicotinamide phosphoribosyltransferase
MTQTTTQSLLPFPPFAADGYKLGHVDQSPPGTTSQYFNLTPRTDRIARKTGTVLHDFDGKIVWANNNHLAKWYFKAYWDQEFFAKPREWAVQKFQEFSDKYLGPGVISANKWEELHSLSYLPLIVKALPEGTRVPVGVTPLTIKETLRQFYWLPGYVETALSSEVWGASTVATIAFEYLRLLTHYAEITGSPKEFVPLQGHDFSARGLKGICDAAHTQVGHLFSFIGTDTVSAIEHVQNYYAPLDPNHCVGLSVPATEHSQACLNIQWELSKLDPNLNLDDRLLLAETAFLKRLLTEVYPSGIFSYVTDTYDYWGVLTKVLPSLKEVILNRVPNALGLAKLVIRPDSGDPVLMVCGDPYAKADSPEHKGSLQVLWEIFGGTTTKVGDKEFKVLNPRIGLIYGDGIHPARAAEILRRMYLDGWASSNIVLGIGSFTYQYHTRDDFGWAMKSTWGEVDGVGLELYKDPKTDDGTKRSARGLLRVEHENGTYVQYQSQTKEQESQGALQPIFIDSIVYSNEHIDEIRSRLTAEIYWNGPATPDIIDVKA